MVLLGSAAAPVLALVFAWAGGAVLVRRAATTAALSALRMPFPSFMAVIVPLVEIVIAGVLLAHPADGAAAALLLVAASHMALTWWAGTGRRCPRVGSARLDPVSWVDVGRNLGLGVLGVLALFGGSRVQAPGLPAAVVVTTTVLVGMVLLAAAELRGRHGRLHGGVAR
ncbi:MAG TPA: MauE/DoxX family redox-associated membrane protein [Acidimicrobiales bacterium]|nr:MauE/DoxX family redox-associated membrane protein [Acidimicrobiales bacterium]